MQLYPQEVHINEQNIAKVTATFKGAYKSIISEILSATDFGVGNRKAILAQIEKILTDLGVDVQSFIEEELPGYYEQGADQAVKQLRNVGAEIGVKEGFNRVHKDAIIALVDDTSRAFGESLSGVARSANVLLGRATRDLLTQKIAEGVIGGKALREVRQTIKGTLQEQGLSALIDKSGRKWELDTYAEMLFRTKAVEARNRGLANRMAENGYDLVQVSNHNSTHLACRVWEGKILSLRGETPGFTTVAEAEAAGLFHPNCRHAINAIVPSIARRLTAYYPDERAKEISQSEIDKLTLPRETAWHGHFPASMMSLSK